MPGYRKRLLKRVVVTKKLLFNKTNIFISPCFLNLENTPTYVGHSIRNFVRLTITCVLWSKRSRMQKTYLKLFKHFQWSVCNVALDPLMTLLVAMSKKLMKYLSSLTKSQPFIESIGKDIFRTLANM